MRPKVTPLWKQDAAALIAVIIYLALAFCVMQLWSILSDQANAFANNAMHMSGK